MSGVVKPVLLFITSTSSPSLSLALITPVQWSVDTRSAHLPHSSLPVAASGSSVSQNSPGHRSVLTLLTEPHLSVRACLPGLKAPSPRPSPLHTTRSTSHRRAPCNSRSRQSVDLSSSLTAELLDWTTPPTSAYPHLTQPRLLYPPYLVQSISSVCLVSKGKSISHALCEIEPKGAALP